MNYCKLLAVCALGLGIAQNAQAISLHEAIAQKKVKITAKWIAGTKPLSLVLHNTTVSPLLVDVPAGSHFQCVDDKAQDMLAINAYAYSIQPGRSVEKQLLVRCMEMHDYSPYMDSEFAYLGDAEERLVVLAKMVNTSKKYVPIAQSLVWALANRDPEFSYSKGDSLAYWPLLKALSPYIKLTAYTAPLYEQYVYVPVPRITYSSRVVMTSYIGPSAKLTLVGKDKAGNVLREYYRDKPVGAGFYDVTIGYNDVVSDSNYAVTYSLTDDKGTVLQERTALNHTLDPVQKVYWLQTGWEMNIEQPIAKATLKLYGPDDKHLLTLYENRSLPVAIRKTPYGFYHTYGKKGHFKVRLTDETGTIIKEVALDAAASEEKKVEMHQQH